MTISGCIYQTEPISRMQSSQISSENVVYNLFVCEVVKSVVLVNPSSDYNMNTLF